MRQCFQTGRGFTLIEVMMVLAMLGMITGALYSLYLTHQRTTYIQDEVVEVQQNLRIALDSITRDIQMAGFLVPFLDRSGTENKENFPIGVVGNNSGLPASDPSDRIILNMASAKGIYARITAPKSGAGGTFILETPEDVDLFRLDDIVRIIRPQNREQPGGASATFKVTRTDRDGTPPAITLDSLSGADHNILYLPGDIIARTADSAPYPNTITYCIGPDSDCGAGVTTCLPGTFCLMRVEDETTSVVAQNIAGLQFRYILDDNTESDLPPDLSRIRAVRTTIKSQTALTTALSDQRAKIREMSSVIHLRNSK